MYCSRCPWKLFHLQCTEFYQLWDSIAEDHDTLKWLALIYLIIFSSYPSCRDVRTACTADKLAHFKNHIFIKICNLSESCIFLLESQPMYQEFFLSSYIEQGLQLRNTAFKISQLACKQASSSWEPCWHCGAVYMMDCFSICRSHWDFTSCRDCSCLGAFDITLYFWILSSLKEGWNNHSLNN